MENLELNLLASTLRTEHWEKIKKFYNTPDVSQGVAVDSTGHH